MSTSLSLILLALLASASPTELTSFLPRVVGGTEVNPPFKYPWMAALAQGNSLLCGGTLIAPSYILTAAHCSYVTQAQNLAVLLHRHDLTSSNADESGIYRTISKVIIHPGFSESNMRNDFALWKLSSPVDNVDPVALDTAGTYQVAGDNVLVMGWGNTLYEGDASNVLLQATLKIWDFSDCSSMWQGGLNPAIQMCAGLPLGGKDTCQGDSGGPILAYGPGNSLIQIGVVSFGDQCANPNSPGVYAYVYGGLDFISAAQNDTRTSLCNTNTCPVDKFCIESVDNAFCASFASFLIPFSSFSLVFLALLFSLISL